MPQDRWDDFRTIFRTHIQTPAAVRTLDELAQLAQSQRVALLCYEADAATCHRAIIAEYVAKQTGLVVDHLRVGLPVEGVDVSNRERAIILVKAAPHPSRRYQETVCCAGVTPTGEWRRLYPIRYRHLAGEAQFARWDILEYAARRASGDVRKESRRVEEHSLRVVGYMKRRTGGLFRPSISTFHRRGR
jgi:hypothetical protein